uniref:Ionotropic glutamate receptor C-terminal domain-containing protein n=1 Tax=Lactuca sativa TaxID=4236 RepID=A0A9R1VJI9_LACSA|nr:hypothetical protein LSAT_V11C500274870 [Lactuca sativa]
MLFLIKTKHLIDEDNVKAILVGHTWEEASAIAEVISEAGHGILLFLSLASTTRQLTQMNAVAAILQSWGIPQVTLIYETSHLASTTSIISDLSQAFRQTGSELIHILPLATGSSFFDEELDVLKKQQRQVFVIHTSLQLGIRLFQAAKKMEMTEDGYLWIATNRLTDLFHSINSTMISSLKGIVGVKSYFPEKTPDFLDFRKRFRQKFRSDYPEEEQDEPGVFALQGYNAVKLLEKVSLKNFDHKRPFKQIPFEIVNVIGKGYHSVYLTEESGFSENVDGDINGATAYSNSMDSVGQVLWPVQPRRNLAGSLEHRMRVGVPGRSLFKQFVNVEYNPEKNQTVIGGFVITVFDEIMRELNLSYNYFPFNGSYDKMMREIPAKTFDTIAGDVTNVSTWHEYLDFTQPYTESGDWLHSNLSRMAAVVWLFVALIITQSYMASFASMLTTQRLEPTTTNVEMLRNMNATVGYCNGSFVNHYLEDVLGFNNIKTNIYNSIHKYAEALNSGEIAAIFLEVPAAKVFLAQYCKSFVRTVETFKVGGFGFAFPRDFPRLSDANNVVIRVTESGKLKELEDKFLISEKSVDEESFSYMVWVT